MDTELLKTFMEVHKAGRFSRAAENLYLTQSAVSFRIRQLEQGLGVALFARQRNQLTLTAAGERLLPHAEAILSNLERAKREVALGEAQHQQLVIGGTANIWDGVLSSALAQFHQALPELAIRAESLPSPALTRQLLERNLDLAVMFDPPKAEGLVVEALPSIRLLPISSCTDGQLGNYIHIDWGSAFDVRFTRELEHLPKPQLRVSSSHMALSFLLRCAGSAYLPEAQVTNYLQQGCFKQIPDVEVIERPIYCAWHEQNTHNELVQRARQILWQHNEA